MSSAWKVLVVVSSVMCAIPALGAAYHPESGVSALETAPRDRLDRETASLELLNYVADRSWVGIHVSPSNTGTWSENLLGAEPAEPGSTVTLRDVPCGGALDIKLVSRQKSTLETRGIVVHCGETRRVALTR